MPLLQYHEKRLNDTRSVFFPNSSPIALTKYLWIPKHFSSGTFKIRCIYGTEIEMLEFHSYVVRDIKTLKVVHDDKVNYAHKYLKRRKLDELFLKKNNADEIIISKNGLITDAYYYNIALRKEDVWFTPSSPLLNGVRKSYLIDSGVLNEREIKLGDLEFYDELSLINALTDLGEITIPISNVFH